MNFFNNVLKKYISGLHLSTPPNKNATNGPSSHSDSSNKENMFFSDKKDNVKTDSSKEKTSTLKENLITKDSPVNKEKCDVAEKFVNSNSDCFQIEPFETGIYQPTPSKSFEVLKKPSSQSYIQNLSLDISGSETCTNNDVSAYESCTEKTPLKVDLKKFKKSELVNGDSEQKSVSKNNLLIYGSEEILRDSLNNTLDSFDRCEDSVLFHNLNTSVDNYLSNDKFSSNDVLKNSYEIKTDDLSVEYPKLDIKANVCENPIDTTNVLKDFKLNIHLNSTFKFDIETEISKEEDFESFKDASEHFDLENSSIGDSAHILTLKTVSKQSDNIQEEDSANKVISEKLVEILETEDNKNSEVVEDVDVLPEQPVSILEVESDKSSLQTKQTFELSPEQLVNSSEIKDNKNSSQLAEAINVSSEHPVSVLEVKGSSLLNQTFELSPEQLINTSAIKSGKNSSQLVEDVDVLPEQPVSVLEVESIKSSLQTKQIFELSPEQLVNSPEIIDNKNSSQLVEAINVSSEHPVSVLKVNGSSPLNQTFELSPEQLVNTSAIKDDKNSSQLVEDDDVLPEQPASVLKVESIKSSSQTKQTFEYSPEQLVSSSEIIDNKNSSQLVEAIVVSSEHPVYVLEVKSSVPLNQTFELSPKQLVNTSAIKDDKNSSQLVENFDVLPEQPVTVLEVEGIKHSLQLKQTFQLLPEELENTLEIKDNKNSSQLVEDVDVLPEQPMSVLEVESIKSFSQTKQTFELSPQRLVNTSEIEINTNSQSIETQFDLQQEKSESYFGIEENKNSSQLVETVDWPLQEEQTKEVAQKVGISDNLNSQIEDNEMAEILEKYSQEIANLKLEVNSLKQAKVSSELEISKKNELILKAEAESLKMEQAHQQELKLLKEELEEKSNLIEKSTTKDLEEAIKLAKAKEAQAISDLHSRVNKELNYQKIMEEYEKTVATHVAQTQKLKEEKETASQHLANLEASFADLHKKYERSKKIIDGFKANEDILKQKVEVFERAMEKQEDKYESLRAHAQAQIEKSNKDIKQLREQNALETSKLKAIVRRIEIKCESLENTLQQKNTECIALSALCDEVTGKKV